MISARGTGMNQKFEPQIAYRALSSHVLVVAATRVEGTWKAYCGAVPGVRHKEEVAAVLRSGDQVGEDLARHLFPGFRDLPYAE